MTRAVVVRSVMAIGATHAGVVCVASDASANDCEAVIGSEALLPFFERAKSGRVDIVGLGDSNQAFGGYGWDHGCTQAISEQLGLYATGLLSAGENAGNGSGLGYTYQGFSTLSTGGFVYAGAPAALDTYMPGSQPLAPLNYLYLQVGEANGGFLNQGMFIDADSPLGTNSRLRFHVMIGEFAGAGTGTCQLSIRLQQPPYSHLVSGPVVSTGAAEFGTRELSLDLPAAMRNATLGFRLSPWGTNLVGPFLAYYMRVENLDRANGASFSTMYAVGGRSARSMASALLSASVEQLTLYFTQVRSLQSAPRRVLIRVNTGLNDRNETLPSLGPAGVADADSAEAFADNITAIMTRIEAIWSLNGWPLDELYFLISVSHPVSLPDDDELVAYREAASALADVHPRTAATRFDRLTSAPEMLANGWYQAGGADRNHLTLPAFVELARRELSAAMPLPCLGDADGSGSVDFSDITKVLAMFDQCAPLAASGDADGNRHVDFGDITSVLTAWNAACAP